MSTRLAMRLALLLVCVAHPVLAAGAQDGDKRPGMKGVLEKGLGGDEPDMQDFGDEDPARESLGIGASDDETSGFEGIGDFDIGAWEESVRPGTGHEDTSRLDDLEELIDRKLAERERERARIAAFEERESQRIRGRWKELDERWREVAEATSDGEKRESSDWKKLFEKHDPPAEDAGPQPPTRQVQPPPAPEVPKASDGLSLDMLEEAGLDEPGIDPSPEDAAGLPFRTGGAGERLELRPDIEERIGRMGERLPIAVPVGWDDASAELDDSVVDLIERVRNGERPDDISARDWASISDRLETDLADIEADAAEARTEVEELEEELEPLAEEIRDARDEFDDLADELSELTPQERRERQERARERDARNRARKFSEARERFREAVGLYQQARGEESGRDAERAGGARGAWEIATETIGALGETEEAFGLPIPPGPDQWDGEDGLPLPEWMRVADTSDRIKVKLTAYSAELQRIIDQVNDIHDIARNRDKRLVRNKRLELRHRDHLRERLGHPLYDAYRRRDLRQLVAELEKTREERIASRLGVLQERADYLIAEMARDVERLGEPAVPEPEVPEAEGDGQ